MPLPTRLATITGVGGSGKTRLAIEAAHRLIDFQNPAGHCFLDGIWFIPLAPLSDPALIEQVIAATLKLNEIPGMNPAEMLSDALRSSKLLLLLDNCEHLRQACALLIKTLLRTCPGIKVLATSRAPLKMLGETILPVPPLETLNPNGAFSMGILARCESVRLFIDRAKAVKPEFVVTEYNAQAVLQICQALDGIPLAIELAAVRVKVLTPQEISGRLNDLFQLLHTTSPVMLERHHNLYITFDWSYSLLEELEQVFFRRLSVFAGGWTLDSAEQIICDPPIARSAVVDLHESLLDHSLIQREDRQQSAQARYRMLVPVWQYAHEKFETAGEANTLRDRHLAYFSNLAEQAQKGILTSSYPYWTNRIYAEISNIRTALNWSMGEGNLALGFKIAISLFQFWQEVRIVSESIKIYQDLLGNPKATDPAFNRERGMALTCLSLSYLRLGDHEKAIQSANAALAIEAAIDDPEIKAYGLAALGHAHGLQEKYAKAVTILEYSLMLFQNLDHIPGQSWALSRLGTVALHMGEYERAGNWLDEMIRLTYGAGITTYLGYALRYSGYVLLYQGNIHGALQKLMEAQAYQLDPEVVISSNLVAFAAIAVATGQIVRAARLSGVVQQRMENRRQVLLPYDLDRHEGNLAILREWLGETVYQQAIKAGRSMTQQQIADEIAAIRVSPVRSPCVPIIYPAGLTEREVEVLRFVTLGMSNQEIADRLVISRRTVHAHVRSIFNKLDVNTRTAAAHEAIRLKLA